MTRNSGSRLRAVFCAAAVVFSVSAAAQKIPALEEVHPALSEPARSELSARRGLLASARASLRTRIDDYEARCHLYFSNSREATECPGKKPQLEADKEAYIAAVKSFNWDLEQAVGDERIRMEKRVREMDEAIRRDAEAVRNLGFSRRAEDFDEWLKVSEEGRRKLSDALSEYIFDQGSEGMLKGVLDKLATTAPAAVAVRLEKLGLGNSESVRKLRAMPAMRVEGKEALNALAEQIAKDVRSAVLFDEKYKQGEKLEALKEAIEFFSPTSAAMEGFFLQAKTTEVAIWSTYDAASQAVAVREVARLNKLTDQQLKALQSIHCVFERHALERYGARLKVAELTWRDVSTLSRPVQSKACARQ